MIDMTWHLRLQAINAALLGIALVWLLVLRLMRRFKIRGAARAKETP